MRQKPPDEFTTFLYNYLYKNFLEKSPTRQKRFVNAYRKWQEEQAGKRHDKWIIFKVLCFGSKVGITTPEWKTIQAIRKKYFFWTND